jgi:hypothetical protein
MEQHIQFEHHIIGKLWHCRRNECENNRRSHIAIQRNVVDTVSPVMLNSQVNCMLNKCFVFKSQQ